MIYFCCDERRRSAVRLLNGIDSLVVCEPASSVATAVLGALGLAGHDLILVRCFGVVPSEFGRDNVQLGALDGRPVAVAEAKPAASLPPAAAGSITDPDRHFVVAVAPGALGLALRHALTLASTARAPLAEFRATLRRVEFFATPRGVWQPTTDAQARAVVRDLNGIDYVEVVDAEAEHPSERQRLLKVFFVKPLAPGRLVAANISIEGGERIRDIKVERVVPDGVTPPPAGHPPNLLEVWVDRPGDFSTYTLRLVDEGGRPVGSFDPLLSAVAFSFKVECPDDFDCRARVTCPPERAEEPEIDYLAKDYDSFRRLMLDRFSVLMPEWGERNAADLGVVLVEMLAYVGDHLSYQQDAIATEAYLGTARRRSSVRRHARLVDYFMHDGSNARVWVQCRVTADRVLLPKGTQLFTHVSDLEPRVARNTNAYSAALSARPEFFETMEDATFYEAHNRIDFYAWGERECCIPEGATRATLRDGSELANRLRLRAGDVLVFAERCGPDTGDEADADPAHRHAVRLTRVAPEASLTPDGRDRVPGSQLTDPLTGQAVVEIEWEDADALPFPLCLSAVTEEEPRRYVADVSVALGNIVLADHGRTVEGERLEVVPKANPRLAVARGHDDCCESAKAEARAPRFRPRLKEAPLTFTSAGTQTRGRRRGAASPASSVYDWDMRGVLPAVTLRVGSGGSVWKPRRDLLSSDEFAPEFVAEVEEDGGATLRFGDDEYGMRPAEGTEFLATYRVGNGARGNIGAESLAHVVTTDTRIASVYNPLPARGGQDAESLEHVRQSAPWAFRTQERAITPEDYAEVAGRHAQVQRAAATMRWTGSWLTVFLTVDRLGGRPVDEEFKAELRRHLERYRLAGHDVEINGPSFVPLEVELYVCILPGYFRSDVRAALLEVLGNRALADGRRGLFHPDKFTFGQSVYLSHVHAAAQGVEGVRFVAVRKLTRFGSGRAFAGLEDGRLSIGRLEIARLDNNPNFPEHGVLRLTLEGGR
ncbi:MAG: putative baseplate assembly protein [Pyrinomonadaceae bacterium]